ncbi:MAG: phage holin family protein [Bacillota bacterium]|nr:phage holin family protein [Bacillota bacterium]
MSTKVIISTISGALTALVTAAYGGWSAGLTTLFCFIIVDFVFGLLLGILNKSSKTATGGLSSSIAFRGICKKIVILLLVFCMYRIDLTIGTAYFKDATIIAFIISEFISIIENAGLIGVPMPAIVTKALDVLNSKMEDLIK